MDDSSCARDLSEMVQRHYALVYRYAYRLSGSAQEAEDLTQQTFLTAQQKLRQLREIEQAKGWLCAIARTAFLHGLRKRRGHQTVSLEKIAEVEEEPPYESPADSHELQNVLNELPEEFRTPLILYYFQEFSYREIAVQMDVPIGTVMSRLARGKAYLRRRLAACQPAAG